jgi:low affinity Fe/Cu permease
MGKHVINKKKTTNLTVGLTIAFLTIAISIGSLKDFSKTSVLLLKNTTTQVVLIPCLALSSATLIPSYVNRQW